MGQPAAPAVLCDAQQAISACRAACVPGVEDEVADTGICAPTGMKCCRATCSGPGSVCMPAGQACVTGFADATGACPAGGVCCTVPGTVPELPPGPIPLNWPWAWLSLPVPPPPADPAPPAPEPPAAPPAPEPQHLLMPQL